MFPVKTKKVFQSFQWQLDQVSDNIDQTSNTRGQDGKCESQKDRKQWGHQAKAHYLDFGLLIQLSKLIKDGLLNLTILKWLLW